MAAGGRSNSCVEYSAEDLVLSILSVLLMTSVKPIDIELESREAFSVCQMMHFELRLKSFQRCRFNQ